MRHMMIDLETFGTTPGSAIATVGAVVFDPTEQEDHAIGAKTLAKNRIFYERVTFESNNKLGLHVDPDSIDWWRQQNLAAQYEVFHEKGRKPLHQILIDLSAWYINRGIDRVWSHGATFDIVLLEEIFRRLGMGAPWRFYHIRDTRTIFDVTNTHYKGIVHHALQDAYQQACAVQAAYKKLILPL